MPRPEGARRGESYAAYSEFPVVGPATPLGVHACTGHITRMIAVVTGSTGFIGSHLVDHLLARGAEVRALVRPETLRDARDARLEQFEADLLDDRSLRES